MSAGDVFYLYQDYAKLITEQLAMIHFNEILSNEDPGLTLTLAESIYLLSKVN